ncbi:MAG: hydrogenase maturation protease [Thermoplasmata archaeon]
MGRARPGRRDAAIVPLVIGLGNEHRGDDAAGLLVARRLGPRLVGIARTIELPSEGTRLLDLWDGGGLVVVVDAVSSGRPPGTVHRIEVGADPLRTPLGATSTHGLSIAEAVSLGQVLGRMPRRLIVFGVEGARFLTGTAVSEAVSDAVEGVAEAIEREIRRERTDAIAAEPGGRLDA